MNNRGTTIIEFLAIIIMMSFGLVLSGPIDNNSSSESSITTWEITGNQMMKSAASYYQLNVLKDLEYITDFKKALASNNKYAVVNEENNKLEYNGINIPNSEEIDNIMRNALEMTGTLPHINNIELFIINTKGEVLLKFKKDNIYCLSTNSDSISKAEYETATLNFENYKTKGILKFDGKVKCTKR